MKKNIKSLFCLAFSIIFIFVLTGCRTDKSENPVENHNNNPDYIVVTDHLGNKVNVPKDIKSIAIGKIYPLPSVIAVFFDSAEKIIGMPEQSMTAAKNSLLSELYPEILNAETNYINGANINIESLLNLNPDVFIYNAADVQHGELCKKAGIPAIAVAVNKWDYNAVETLNNWIDLLSKLFPENEKSELVKSYSENVIARINDINSQIPEAEKENVFFLYQYSESTITTSGKHFFGQWWADTIGTNNVAGGIDKDNSISVNMEQIYTWNPECIFITNFTSAQPEDLYNDSDWSEIDAVKNKRVFKMPLGMYRSYTCGVDTPVTLLWLAKTAYPEYYKDVDITHETKKYYKEVFGIDLTDEQADSIFTPVSEASAF